jgi:hypothetical protein
VIGRFKAVIGWIMHTSVVLRLLTERIETGYISPIHTFVNIPALLLKNTLRVLIRAGILTKV